MSARRSMSRRRQRTLRRAGARPWSDAPHLWPIVAAPVLAAFAGGPPISSCVHVDGLADLASLDRIVVWAPSIVRSLTCAECNERLLVELRAAGDDVEGLPCDGCSTVTSDLTSFTTAFEHPDALLQIIGAFCADCLEGPPEEAA